MELSTKAALRAVGVEYPKEHEVSDLFSEFKVRFPAWFISDISFIQETSTSLFKKRELAFYGGEEAFLAPEDVISEDDANRAVTSADRVFQLCSKLVDKLAKTH